MNPNVYTSVHFSSILVKSLLGDKNKFWRTFVYRNYTDLCRNHLKKKCISKKPRVFRNQPFWHIFSLNMHYIQIQRCNRNFITIIPYISVFWTLLSFFFLNPFWQLGIDRPNVRPRLKHVNCFPDSCEYFVFQTFRMWNTNWIVQHWTKTAPVIVLLWQHGNRWSMSASNNLVSEWSARVRRDCLPEENRVWSRDYLKNSRTLYQWKIIYHSSERKKSTRQTMKQTSLGFRLSEQKLWLFHDHTQPSVSSTLRSFLHGYTNYRTREKQATVAWLIAGHTQARKYHLLQSRWKKDLCFTIASRKGAIYCSKKNRNFDHFNSGFSKRVHQTEFA